MSTGLPHECFMGLLTCGRHPRWKVVRPFSPRAALAYPWWVYRPDAICVERCATWDEAVAYATAQARASMVAAVQDGAA